MPQAYDPNSADVRTFGDQIARLDADLKRPDLLGDIPDYLRDAIRFHSRNPFFFTQIDNSNIGPWAPSLQVTRGYTIYDVASDASKYIFVALNDGLVGTGSIPSFTPVIFQPRRVAGRVFQAGDAGTTVDNQVTWATVRAWTENTDGAIDFYWTQLTTVPTFNKYTPPIDYAAPYRVEVTIPSLRYELGKTSYNALRNVDVIRPAPITVYPADYAWFSQKIFLWPYPVGFYPLTLSYYTAPFPPRMVNESNFWTTTAERLIRKYAAALLESEVIRDDASAAKDFQAAAEELKSIKSLESEQISGPIPPSDW
jgi:hypothetical protein